MAQKRVVHVDIVARKTIAKIQTGVPVTEFRNMAQKRIPPAIEAARRTAERENLDVATLSLDPVAQLNVNRHRVRQANRLERRGNTLDAILLRQKYGV